MTPREIVSELDRYIVGQRAAKRAVAIALRNRWRRQQVAEELRDEIAPKNIIMIGPTGRREDRDLAPPRQARAGAVPQGRGLEVHRGRLRRPRRRVDHPRPDRARDQHGEGGGEGEGPARARASSPRSACSTCCCRRVPSGIASRRRRRRGSRRRDAGHAREAPPHAARGQARRPHRRARGDASRSCPMVEIMTPQGMEEIELQPEGPVLEPAAEEDQEADACTVPEALELLDAGGGQPADRHGRGDQGGGPPRRAVRHRLHRRDRQDRRPRGRARPRRVARGRAARPAADRRRLDRQHQVRHGAHRPHPLHRLGRVPHHQAVRPDPRVPGPLPDPRRARAADAARTSSAS